jgi:hypothetical protein
VAGRWPPRIVTKRVRERCFSGVKWLARNVDPWRSMTLVILVVIAVVVPFGTLSLLLLGALCVLRLARLFGSEPKVGVARAERLRLRVAAG